MVHFWFIFQLLAATVAAVRIASNTIKDFDKTTIPTFNSLSIDSGIFFTVLNNQYTTQVFGDLTNSGLFFLAQTKFIPRMAFTLQGGNFKNTGTFALAAFNTAQLSHQIVNVNLFVNTGKMYLGVGSPYFDAAFQIHSLGEWTNSGVIVLKQQGSNQVSAIILDDVSHVMTNTGSMCLYGVLYQQASNLVGNGCIFIGPNSYFELKCNTYTFDSSMSIYLADSTSALELLSMYYVNPPTALVYGFGNGNKITTQSTINKWWYSVETGILTLSNWGSNFNFKIGKGYDQSEFQVVYKWGNMVGVQYNGPSPNAGAPVSCSACLSEFPVAPVSDTPASTISSYWSQSYSSQTTITGNPQTVIIELPKTTKTQTTTWERIFPQQQPR